MFDRISFPLGCLQAALTRFSPSENMTLAVKYSPSGRASNSRPLTYTTTPSHSPDIPTFTVLLHVQTSWFAPIRLTFSADPGVEEGKGVGRVSLAEVISRSAFWQAAAMALPTATTHKRKKLRRFREVFSIVTSFYCSMHQEMYDRLFHSG